MRTAWFLYHDLKFFNTTALTGISTAESCVSYLGRGFFKFFSFRVCFLTFRLSHGLSNLRLLAGEETSLVFDTRLRLISFEAPRGAGEQEISNLIQGFACNCCVDVSWCFTASYSQALLAEKSCTRLVFYGLQSRFREKLKWRSSSARYRADNAEVNTFFLNSPTYCKRSLSISDRNFSLSFYHSNSFWLSKKTKCPHALLPLLPFTCLWSWRQNVPKWAGKLCSLIVRTLNFDWPAQQNMFSYACGQVVASDGS